MTATVHEPTFALPPDREASGPPESRGLARDDVALLVSDRNTMTHARFHELGTFLVPGDLVVVNNSATLSAAVDARLGTRDVVLHFSTWLDDHSWVVEIRSPDRTPASGNDIGSGARLLCPGGVVGTLRRPWLDGSDRLWVADITGTDSVVDHLARWGRPITYTYLRDRWSAFYYRTAFGLFPGSAEMPSAARPFTDRLVTELASTGISFAPITLHTGVSSPEAGEPPSPERFAVSAATARIVNETRASGGRVVAVGTTVTRALESVVDSDGRAHAAAGWTDLVLAQDRPTRLVDGLITGWHAPGASHLNLLEAVVGVESVRRAYDSALAGDYLWHEFGDSALLLRS
ncbi:S-adenosylmethionine:tRNA ribosyltransferase-isomerase [Antrihabitans sp. NCIMB 15449]|jgi:S-adenosylmethionine:tRNA ribosyltransferase-isomerase|uniref:S-adenosylmethionine:tRNA ribosyltransferase-isomerase n=1 Tax=Antrihabitans spumae TaxID=3373370 RepID=A0ABW7JNR3_9NOCA